MIANLFNVALGLALVYAAILRPSLFAARPTLLLVAAVLIVAAAWIARRTDHEAWQGNCSMALAVILAAITAMRLEHFPLAVFWSVFTVGTTVAVLALWAALYRPGESRG